MHKPRLTVQRSTLASFDLNTAKLPAKQRQAFYGTAEWRALVAILRSARGHRCEVCGRSETRLYADHVVELQDGGAALDLRNLMLLCGECHSRKTVRERARRLAARH